MKHIFSETIRKRVGIKVRGLLVLGFVVITFVATPLVSFAHDASDARRPVNGIFNFCSNGGGNNGDCGLLGNLFGNFCINNCGNSSNCGTSGDCSNNCGNGDCSLDNILGNICGNGDQNSSDDNSGDGNNIDQSLSDCIKNLISKIHQDISDLLNNLPSLCGDNCNCGGNCNDPSQDKTKLFSVSNNQPNLPFAKLAGILQFSTKQVVSNTFGVPQTRSVPDTTKFKIIPAKVTDLKRGEFIAANFNGQLELGVAIGVGRANLFDSTTRQPKTVQLF